MDATSPSLSKMSKLMYSLSRMGSSAEPKKSALDNVKSFRILSGRFVVISSEDSLGSNLMRCEYELDVSRMEFSG